MLKNFRTYQLAVELYKGVKTLGLKGELRDQLERASLSIVCNLAEGGGKTQTRDRRRYFDIALGSARETQALLGRLEGTEMQASQTKADQVGAHLWKLIQNTK